MHRPHCRGRDGRLLQLIVPEPHRFKDAAPAVGADMEPAFDEVQADGSPRQRSGASERPVTVRNTKFDGILQRGRPERNPVGLSGAEDRLRVPGPSSVSGGSRFLPTGRQGRTCRSVSIINGQSLFWESCPRWRARLASLPRDPHRRLPCIRFSEQPGCASWWPRRPRPSPDRPHGGGLLQVPQLHPGVRRVSGHLVRARTPPGSAHPWGSPLAQSGGWRSPIRSGLDPVIGSADTPIPVPVTD